MAEQIFLLDKNKSLIELNEEDYINENQFQELLEKYPKLIPGSQINPDNPRKWIFISREIGVPDEELGTNKWSLDHLFIDQDGIPTLIEVKRSSDTRIRREVVGQMLDYAANAVSYWSVEEIRSKFESLCNENDLDSELQIQELTEEESIEDFWELVDTNLKTGKIRMLFVADKIPKELQRIIEFLNEQMSPAEVLGVALKQFGNEKIKTLVPQVIGQTSSAQIKKGSKKIKWTEETFLKELSEKKGEFEIDFVKRILNHFENKISRVWFGEGQKFGSLSPVLDFKQNSFYFFVMWTDGTIGIRFHLIKQKKPFDNIEKRKELLRKLNTIDKLNIPENKIDGRPWFYMKLLKKQSEYDKFVQIFDWYLDEVKKSKY